MLADKYYIVFDILINSVEILSFSRLKYLLNTFSDILKFISQQTWQGNIEYVLGEIHFDEISSGNDMSVLKARIKVSGI